MSAKKLQEIIVLTVNNVNSLDLNNNKVFKIQI